TRSSSEHAADANPERCFVRVDSFEILGSEKCICQLRMLCQDFLLLLPCPEAQKKLLEALLHQLCIDLARVVVCLFGLGKLGCGDLAGLLRPALIARSKAPLGTLARSANGFAVH